MPSYGYHEQDMKRKPLLIRDRRDIKTSDTENKRIRSQICSFHLRMWGPGDLCQNLDSETRAMSDLASLKVSEIFLSDNQLVGQRAPAGLTRGLFKPKSLAWKLAQIPAHI
jgi:hypothetical protein